MEIRKNIEIINILLNKIFEFINKDEIISQDFQKYIESVTNSETPGYQLQSSIFSYVLEEKPSNQDKKVIDIFIEKEINLSDEEKNILSGFTHSLFSTFKIEKVNKAGFELYNLANERYYKTVIPLVKMISFRGISAGEYIECRIFPYMDQFYIIGINNIISRNFKESIYKHIVMQQLEKPELLYENNEEKLHSIEKSIHELGIEFINYFKNNEIITSSEYMDELLGGFNDFIESGDADSLENIDKLTVLPEKFAYFEIKEVSGESLDPLQTAIKGFPSSEKAYDVGIIFDSDSGLLILPFYGTFRQIFSSDDYKSIEGYKDCILKYLESDKVPPAPILKIYNENKENFIKIIIETLELDDLPDIQKLLHKYKEKYYTKKTFSALTILYLSNTFGELMEILKENHYKTILDKTLPDHKAGRNDSCPCGSGKKYKKCCLE